MRSNLLKKCIAEFLGTFALIFFGCGSMILYELNNSRRKCTAKPTIRLMSNSRENTLIFCHLDKVLRPSLGFLENLMKSLSIFNTCS